MGRDFLHQNIDGKLQKGERMRLVFKKNYSSIESFSPVEIPDFVVLTGVNGSGKSHLLEAIQNKCVVIEGMESAHIVSFNNETFKLDNENEFNGQLLAAEREQAWLLYESAIRSGVSSWKSVIGDDYSSLRDACKKEKKSLLSLSSHAGVINYHKHLDHFFKQPNLFNNAQARGIYSLARGLPYALDEITRIDFFELYKPYSFKNDFLPYQLGKIFWDYYIKYKTNQINEFENEKHGKEHQVVSEVDFFRVHGEKPWEAINKILGSFGTLKYRVNSPEEYSYYGSYQLKLKHVEKEGLEIHFSNLSSGEKVLMALVASVYKSASDRSFPDVLLLDEVDASLHPSMIKNMLNAIEKVFLDHNTKVILVTHSPTTIALSPDDSVYLMNPSGSNRIVKSSKQDALQVLTQGFATIEQGLKLFDQVAKNKITVISEGNNANIIRLALDLHKFDGVEVLSGVEGISGKNQLKTIYDFFSCVSHQNKVLFVWDSDGPQHIVEKNNTYPFKFTMNDRNGIAKNGIENLFDEHLFSGFVKTVTMSNRHAFTSFDETRKKDFEKFVFDRKNPEDFKNFSSLFNEIRRISGL